jgi:DNA-binding Lrp family transcriptional regulator
MMPFVRSPKWVVNSGMHGQMSRSALVVMLSLGNSLDSRDDCGLASVARIAKATGLTERAIRNGMAELVRMGILIREPRSVEYRFYDPNRNSGSAERNDDSVERNDGSGPDELNGTVVPHDRNGGSVQPEQPFRTIGRNKDSSRTTLKNYLQEGEREPVMVMHKGKRVSPYHSAAPLLTATGWPENRWCGETGVRAITKALVRISDGCEGESAASDPVQWLGARMNAAAKSTDDPRFVPKITKWLEENYPHLISEGEPAQ